MKLSNAYPGYLPFTRPVVISEVRALGAGATLPPHLVPGSTWFVRSPVFGNIPVRQEPAVAGKAEAAAAPPGPTLAGLATSAGIGLGIAKPLVKLTAVPNTTSTTQLAHLLTQYNVAPQHAQTMAGTILDFVKSRPGKTVLLALAAGALTLAAVEAVRPDLPWKRKLPISLMVAALAAVVIVILIAKGVLTR